MFDVEILSFCDQNFLPIPFLKLQTNKQDYENLELRLFLLTALSRSKAEWLSPFLVASRWEIEKFTETNWSSTVTHTYTLKELYTFYEFKFKNCTNSKCTPNFAIKDREENDSLILIGNIYLEHDSKTSDCLWPFLSKQSSNGCDNVTIAVIIFRQ